MSESSSSPNLLENDDDDVSPISSTAKDNTSSAVDASGDEDSSWRKQSDTSSSPNLVVNGKPNNEVEALDDDESSDEEAPTKAQVVQKAKSVRSTHKKVVEVEAEEEEPLPDAEDATSCITKQSFLFRNEWCIDFRTELNFCCRRKDVAFFAIVYCILYLSALSAYGSFQYNQIERGQIQPDLSPNVPNDLEMA